MAKRHKKRQTGYAQLRWMMWLNGGEGRILRLAVEQRWDDQWLGITWKRG